MDGSGSQHRVMNAYSDRNRLFLYFSLSQTLGRISSVIPTPQDFLYTLFKDGEKMTHPTPNITENPVRECVIPSSEWNTKYWKSGRKKKKRNGAKRVRVWDWFGMSELHDPIDLSYLWIGDPQWQGWLWASLLWTSFVDYTWQQWQPEHFLSMFVQFKRY